MANVAKTLAEMRESPSGIRFEAAIAVATHYFGAPRKSGSHRIFKMPWPGAPRVNLQESSDGKAKAYQVRQLLDAVAELERRGGG